MMVWFEDIVAENEMLKYLKNCEYEWMGDDTVSGQTNATAVVTGSDTGASSVS